MLYIFNQRGIKSPFDSPLLDTINGALGLAGAAADITYLMRSALNASNPQPLTKLDGTALTQTATGSVVIPTYASTIAAGTTLVTVAAGYPVVPNARITYDTALGATVSGIELCGDPGFTGGWWSVGGNVTVNTTPGKMVATAAAANSGAYRSTAMTTGNWYRAVFTIDSITEGGFAIQKGIGVGPTNSTPGTYTLDFQAQSAIFGIYTVGASTSGVIDNCSLNAIVPAFLPTDTAAAALATSATVDGLTQYSSGPTGNPVLGILCEPADTASGLHSRDLSNAAWAATNCAGVKNATGTDDVANSASTLTASGADATLLQTVTLASGARGFFPYIKRKTGTGAVYVTIDDGGTWTEVTVNATTWVRGSSIKTAANPIFGFKLATSGDAIYVDHANLFNTAVATSPIPTTTAAVTRPVRYLSGLVGSELGTNIKCQIYLNEIGREKNIICSFPARLYVNATNYLVFTDGESTMTSSGTLSAATAYDVELALTAGAWSLKLDDSEVATDTTGGYVIWQ